MSRKESFIAALCRYCDDDSHGYDQANRWGPDFDCSSLMHQCAHEAGYDVQVGWGNTSSMLGTFTKAGWTAVAYTDQDLNAIPGGCIMLNCGNHTEGVIRAGQWGGAHINEHGGVTGGATGDQTGKEVSRCNPYHYASYPNDWDYILYPPDDGGESSDADETETATGRSDGQTGSGVSYEAHTEDGWQGSVSKADDTEDGYAGFGDKAIDGVRAYRQDGKPLRVQAILDNGETTGWTSFNASLTGTNFDGDGYAGDIGEHDIIGLRVEGCECRVAVKGGKWLGWSSAGTTTAEGDDFAGEDLDRRLPIVALQMRCQ